jgi:exosortase
MGTVKPRLCCRYARPVLGGDGTWRDWAGIIAAVLVLLLITVWSYGPLFRGLARGWSALDDYSAGQLVPLVAAFLIWRERKALRQASWTPCWWGIVLVLLSQAARTYGLVFMFESIERYSLLLAVAGLVLLVGGWQVFRHLSWILSFLFLMMPLPGRVHNLIGGPLQRLATSGSVFGTRVSQEGNVVMLGDNTPMAVAEACSGLRMLTAFIIVAAFIAYMVKRPRWQKGILLASSIPVAVACNIIRIFLTAMIMLYVSVELGEKFFHDLAGYVMMPAAVSLIFSEIWLMDRIVETNESAPARKQKQAVVVRSRSARHVAPETP